VPTEIHRGEDDIPEDNRIIDISCGQYHTVLLFEDGKHIWTLGRNEKGQLGHGDNENINIPTNIPRGELGEYGLPEDVRIVRVSCGIYHTVLLSEDGHVWTFGNNGYGQLGHGDMGKRNKPTEIQDFSLRNFGYLTKSANKK